MVCTAGTKPLYGEYAQDICDCYDRLISGQERGITEYVCGPNGNDFNVSRIAYQVILDKKFRVIDKEVETWIKSLRESSTSDVE